MEEQKYAISEYHDTDAIYDRLNKLISSADPTGKP